MTTDQTLPIEARYELAHQFLTCLKSQDWALMRSLVTDDSTWTMPGAGTISGTAVGGDAVVARAQQIVSYGLNFALQHVLIGQHGLTLSLRNTAKRGALVLDEHLATVCHLRAGKIAGIDTYISDIEGFNAFFAQ